MDAKTQRTCFLVARETQLIARATRHRRYARGATASGLVLFVSLLLAAGVSNADESGKPARATSDARSEWLQAPPTRGAMTERDAKARRELLIWLDEDQSDEFQQAYRTTIPEVPTGLPDDYDIAIYGSYFGSLRCLIQVRGGKATGEYQATGGVRRRGQAMVELIDARVRQLAYAMLARYEPLIPDAPPVGTTSGNACSHAPFLRVQIVSRRADRPWRLTTDARQLCGGQIDFALNGLRGYCHQRLIGDILEDTDRWRDVADETRHAADTLQELRELADRVTKLGPLAERLRVAPGRPPEIVRPEELDDAGLERAFVDGRILAFRAIDARLRDAAPLLEQVGQAARAELVRLVTSQDVVAVRQALKSKELEVVLAGLKGAAALPAPLGADLLVESLPDMPWSPNEQVGRAMETVALQERHIAALRELRRKSDDRSEFARDLAQLALFRADDESAYKALRELATTRGTFSPAEFNGITELALLAIFETASRTGRRHADAATLARTWLSQRDSRPRQFEQCEWLARTLGLFGQEEDAAQLTQLAERSQGTWRVAALQGLAALDPQRALEMAREDMRRLLAQSIDDRNSDDCFEQYLNLFFWRRDVEVLAQLQPLLGEPGTETQELEPWRRRRVEVLVNYLRERDLDERINWTFAYFRDVSPRQFWLRRVIKQLQDEGADAEARRALAALVDGMWLK